MASDEKEETRRRRKGQEAAEPGAEQDEREDRLAQFYSTRADRKGRLRRRAYFRASRVRHQLELDRVKRREPPPAPPGGMPTDVNWTPLGPTTVAFGQASSNPAVSGRVTSLAVGPGGTRVYAGAANGGVWITADSGANWRPLDDYFVSGSPPAGVEADSLAIGALGVQFGATMTDDVVYVGTGESNQSLDSYLGVGIRRLGPPSGGGAPAWTLEATNLAGRWISRIVVDADTPDTVYAATSIGLFRRPAGGAATWTALTPTTPPADTRATDVVAASTGAERRYYVAYRGGVVWMLDPATSTWTQLTGLVAAPGAWVVLAATRVPGGAANQRVVYALTQAGRLFRLAPGSTSFTEVTGMPTDSSGNSAVVAGGQGWYDLFVEIEPGTADTVWLVGDYTRLGAAGQFNLSLWRGALTGTGGASPSFGFTNTANPSADATYRGLNVHADGHALAFPSNGLATPVWVGCDGGVFSSATGANGSFQPRNTGLAITEMNYLAQRPDTDAIVFCGCQDNGTVRFRGEPAWFESPRGDGGGIAVDPNDQYRVMRQYVRAGRWTGPAATLPNFSPGLSVSTDGGAGSGSWSGLVFPPAGAAPTLAQKTAVNVEDSRTGFYGPIVAADNAGTTVAAFGTNRVWYTRDWGATWATLPANTNPYGGGGSDLTQDVLDDPDPTTAWTSGGNAPGAVTALAFPSGTRLFVATRNQVWRIDDTGGSGGPFTRTALPTTGLPAGRTITGLGVADAAIGSVYVTVGGPTGSHVFFFAGGAAAGWTDANLNVGGTTLNVPCHAVVVDPANPNTVYVGSDVGVWRGQKTGATSWTWVLFSQGLPEAAVTDLTIHPLTRLLRAATHGRGVWEIELDAASLPSPELYLRVNAADTGRLTGGARRPWVENHQDPTRRGFNVWHWMSTDIKVRRPSLAGLPTIGSPPDLLDFAINVGDYVDTNNIETIDPTTSRVFVQVHNRSLSSIASNDVRVLLLICDASLGLPSLPSGYAANIVAGNDPNRPMGWLAGSQWWAGDAASPYQVVPGELSARISRVVAFDVDISPLMLPATHEHVCAAAFATTISAVDQLTSTEPSLDVLTMHDRHAVHRNLHVVPAGSTPTAGDGGISTSPQTFFLDLQNPFRRAGQFEVEFHRSAFDGRLSMLLGASSRAMKLQLRDWEAMPTEKLPAAERAQWRRWSKAVQSRAKEIGKATTAEGKRRLAADPRIERLRKLETLVANRAYVLGTSDAPRFGLTLGAHARVTAAFTWVPPRDAKVGDQYRLDIVHRQKKRIVGGNTYVFGIVAEPEA
jgi:hypothetical protein